MAGLVWLGPWVVWLLTGLMGRRMRAVSRLRPHHGRAVRRGSGVIRSARTTLQTGITMPGARRDHPRAQRLARHHQPAPRHRRRKGLARKASWSNASASMAWRHLARPRGPRHAGTRRCHHRMGTARSHPRLDAPQAAEDLVEFPRHVLMWIALMRVVDRRCGVLRRRCDAPTGAAVVGPRMHGSDVPGVPLMPGLALTLGWATPRAIIRAASWPLVSPTLPTVGAMVVLGHEHGGGQPAAHLLLHIGLHIRGRRPGTGQ